MESKLELRISVFIVKRLYLFEVMLDVVLKTRCESNKAHENSFCCLNIYAYCLSIFKWISIETMSNRMFDQIHLVLLRFIWSPQCSHCPPINTSSLPLDYRLLIYATMATCFLNLSYTVRYTKRRTKLVFYLTHFIIKLHKKNNIVQCAH